MSRSDTSLSSMLAGVARAVTSTQKELDRLESPADLPYPPLAFVVKQAEVTLLGNLSMQIDDLIAARGRSLNLALVNRVQASLRGNHGTTLNTRVSVSIQAIEPPHGR